MSNNNVLNPMKKILIFACCLFFSFTANAQVSYLKYPQYQVVVKKFFDTYTLSPEINPEQLRFEKRPTGWHVCLLEYTVDADILSEELFWDRNKNKFKKLAFGKTTSKGENQEHLDRFKNSWDKELYSICPFYGYTGWDGDVISEFKDVANLPDSTLYALGRAYSSYAANLVNNNSGLADKKVLFDLPAGKNCMTPEQLEKFRFYSHKAIEKYNQVAEMNPDYQTIVGSIGIKASNEYLTSFLTLRILQNEQEAQNELVDGLYNELYIALAKNYLASCEPDAILFTNGDNDTYPLLYVQSKYGFRSDVLVVNVSLLQTERYINSLREQILDAKALPISLTPEHLSGEKRSFIVLNNSDESPADLGVLMDFVKDDENIMSIQDADYYNLPTNKFRLNHGANSVEWEIDKNYIYRNHLVILDMLATNQWERPVCFAFTLDPDAYVGLADYLQLEGLAYRLSSLKKNTTDEQLGSVNSKVMFENLMTSFDWSGLDALSSNEFFLCGNYRFIFQRLADALIRENKTDSAKLVLNRSLEIFPNEILPFDFSMLLLIKSYYELQEFGIANEMIKQILLNLKADLISQKGLSANELEDYKEAGRNWIRELAIRYDQDEIVRELDEK